LLGSFNGFYPQNPVGFLGIILVSEFVILHHCTSTWHEVQLTAERCIHLEPSRWKYSQHCCKHTQNNDS